MKPDAFELTLPDGKKVLCRRKDAEAIRQDVMLRGGVMLVKSEGSDVYERVDPDSIEAASLAPGARHIA